MSWTIVELRLQPWLVRAFCVLLLATLPLELAGLVPLRRWTSLSGHVVEGRLVYFDGREVLIRTHQKREEIRVQRHQLSQADQRYLAKWLEKRRHLTAPWPKSVRLEQEVEVTTVPRTPEQGLYQYETEHFVFRCDAELSPRLTKHCIRVFETTFLAAEQVPLGLKPNGEKKLEVRLFARKEDYVALRGDSESAGFYARSDQTSYIPLSSLGVEKRKNRYEPAKNPHFHTVIHEVTHQCMDRWYGKLPTWFMEGYASWIEVVPYARGEFDFAALRLRDALYNRSGQLGKIDLLPLDELFDEEGGGWRHCARRYPGRKRELYTTAFVLTHYFLHFDKPEAGRSIRHYLYAADHGETEESMEAFLLKGRDKQKLIQAIEAAFAKERVTFNYLQAVK